MFYFLMYIWSSPPASLQLHLAATNKKSLNRLTYALIEGLPRAVSKRALSARLQTALAMCN